MKIRAALLLVVLAGGCSRTGALTADLAPVAPATPLVFHGNCVTGWLLALDLRLTETGDAAVTLDSFSYGVVDEGTGLDLTGPDPLILDAAAFESVAGSRVVPA